MQEHGVIRNHPEVSCEKRVLLAALALLITGTVGYFMLPRGVWIFYFFAHLGALGVLGLFGCATGALARKKGRGYWRAFTLGFALPVATGVAAVLLYRLEDGERLYCGGSISLLVAMLMVVFYLFAKKKTPPLADPSG
jgi:hypothetical protein